MMMYKCRLIFTSREIAIEFTNSLMMIIFFDFVIDDAQQMFVFRKRISNFLEMTKKHVFFCFDVFKRETVFNFHLVIIIYVIDEI